MVLNLYEITGERRENGGLDWTHKIQTVASNPSDAIEACEPRLHKHRLKITALKLVYEDVLLVLP